MTTSDNINLGPEWLRNRPVLSKFRYGAEEMLGLWACTQACPSSLLDQVPELAADQPNKPVSVSEEETSFRGGTSDRGRGRGRLSGSARGGSTGQRRYDYNSRYYGNNDRNSDSDNWRRRDPGPDITSDPGVNSTPHNVSSPPNPGISSYYSPFSIPITTTVSDTATSIIDDKETNSWKRTGLDSKPAIPPSFTDSGSHGAVLRGISQTLETTPVSTAPQPPLFPPYTSPSGGGKEQMEFLKQSEITSLPQDNPVSIASSSPSNMYSNPSNLSSHLPLSMGSPKLMDPGPNLFSSPLKREPESFPSLSEIGSSLQSQVTPDVTTPSISAETQPPVPSGNALSSWGQGNIWGDPESLSLKLSPQYNMEESQKKAAEEMKREIEQAMAEQKRKDEQRRILEKEVEQRLLAAKREEEQRQREEMMKEELRQQKLFEEEAERLRLEKERLQKERLAQQERVRLELEEAERARIALEEERIKLEREREEVKRKEEEMKRIAELERLKKEEEQEKRRAAEKAAAEAKAIAKAQEEAKVAARVKAAAEATIAAAKRNPWAQNTEPVVLQYDPWSNLQKPDPPKRLSQVSPQQPKGWGKPGSNTAPMSLSQIQKAEIQNKGSRSKPVSKPAEVPKQQTPGWGSSAKKSAKSLAEIQKEEEAFNKERQNYTYARQNEWNPVAGMLDEEVEATRPSVTKSNRSHNNENKQQSNKRDGKQNKQSKQNKPSNNKATTPLMRMFNTNNSSRDEFTLWCEQQVESFKNPYIDVPTFISFLNDVESPLDVREYVVSYLGDTKSTDEFIKEFVARRKRNHQNNSENDTGNNFAGNNNNPSKKQGKQAHQPQQTFSKKGKRKKMQKVNAAQLLGINCTASSDARNRGDIDTVIG